MRLAPHSFWVTSQPYRCVVRTAYSEIAFVTVAPKAETVLARAPPKPVDPDDVDSELWASGMPMIALGGLEQPINPMARIDRRAIRQPRLIKLMSYPFVRRGTLASHHKMLFGGTRLLATTNPEMMAKMITRTCHSADSPAAAPSFTADANPR